MPAVLFRCDGGPELGMGHLMRCRALAAEFAALGWNCAFAVTKATAALLADATTIVVPAGLDGARAVAESTTPFDCLVVDHYGLDANFETAARGRTPVVLVIDDLADRPHACDVLIDPNPGRTEADYAGLVPRHARFLLGPQYALLRREFVERRPAEERPPRRQAGRLLITFGGADPDNMSERALQALQHLSPTTIQTTLVIGPANRHRERLTALANRLGVQVAIDPPDLAALMLQADMAIASASTSCWELACLGVPGLLVVTADNQRPTARAAQQAGTAVVLGGSDHLDAQSLAAAIASLASDEASRGGMSAAGRKLVDGRGAARVATAVAELVAAKQQENRS